MDSQNSFTPECPLCRSNHSVFDVTGCFNKSVENILKEHPHHFDRIVKRS